MEKITPAVTEANASEYNEGVIEVPLKSPVTHCRYVRVSGQPLFGTLHDAERRCSLRMAEHCSCSSLGIHYNGKFYK